MICSLSCFHGGAETTSEPDEHCEPSHNPKCGSHEDVVSVVPDEGCKGVVERSGTNFVEFGEEQRGNYDKADELNHASAHGAVDGGDSGPVVKGADEHEDSVEADDAEDSSHEASDNSQVGASGLAVKVTVLNELNLSLEEILVFVSVPAERSTLRRGKSGVKTKAFASGHLLAVEPGVGLNMVRS